MIERTIEHKYFAEEQAWEWVGTVALNGAAPVEFFASDEGSLRRKMSQYILSVLTH